MADELCPSPPDRRRHPRYDLFAQVYVKQAKTDYVLELRNISRSGVLVLLGTLPKPAWIDIDRRIELSIVNPETPELPRPPPLPP